MELPKYIHSHLEDLPKTLASRVSFLRNGRRLHIAELAYQAKVSMEFIEDIEAGIETWLPTSVRQRIARVLKVDPFILEEVEVKNKASEDLSKTPPAELIERIQEEILSDVQDIKCPLCGNKIKSWIQDGLDLNGLPIKSVKGHCTVCVFQLKVSR